MSWLDAVWMGILEGLTEFLPVSSTGHLILLGDRLGANSPGAKSLEVVIQLGAVLAVVVYYRARLWALVRGVLRRDPAEVRLAIALAIAFVPAAALGYLFHKKIKEWLFAPRPVAVALIVGGVLMIGVELALKYRKKKAKDDAKAPSSGAPADGLGAVGFGRAIAIGMGQCLSLWPGASRSMSTIVAGQVAGLDTPTAADFSFLLAIPTLGAATVFDLAKNYRDILAMPGGTTSLGVGMVVSFAVALGVIAVFLRYLKRFGLAPFGVYRILLGIVVLLYVAA